jgi:hypothetical protein
MYLSVEGEKNNQLKSLFTEELPRLMSKVKDIQDQIKGNLERSVSEACSQESEITKEYQNFAKATLEDLQKKIESDKEEDEKSSFNVISWLGGSLSKFFTEKDSSKDTSVQRVGKAIGYVQAKYHKFAGAANFISGIASDGLGELAKVSGLDSIPITKYT